MSTSIATTEPLPSHWFGVLTISNVEQVADLLRRLLAGKNYTWVATNEGYAWKPEVRLSQRIKPGWPDKDPITVHQHETWAHLIVCDTYGVWSLSTHSLDGHYDGKFTDPYFSFERDRVTITHRVPAGHLCHWLLVVEGEATEEAATKHRTSIATFASSEAARFDREAATTDLSLAPDSFDTTLKCERLTAKASILRTFAAQVARGDDLQPRFP